MRQEVLVITAADIHDALHGDTQLGYRVLELLAALAEEQSILVRIDFPGRTSTAGGVEITPRRMRAFSRWCWRLGTAPLQVTWFA